VRFGWVLGAASVVLAACNAAAPPPSAPPAPIAGPSQAAALPAAGGTCQAHIARYRAVQSQDQASGNIAASVYAQVKSETDAAEAQCGAGHRAEAEAMIRASEVKHGYPSGI
jgi:hypothetical protein